MKDTLKEFAQNPRNREESDHDTLVQWLIEIEDAIEDGEEVSAENMEAWESRPSVWEKTGFNSGVVIDSDPRGAEVWAKVDPEHLSREERRSAATREAARQDAADAEKYGTRPGFNRGVAF